MRKSVEKRKKGEEDCRAPTEAMSSTFTAVLAASTLAVVVGLNVPNAMTFQASIV